VILHESMSSTTPDRVLMQACLPGMGNVRVTSQLLDE
jgi:hypothetical protein